MPSPRNLCVVVAVGYALVHAVLLAWVSDDAFISFRYARNLVDGLGLVYNAQEPKGPVEGYTNFLWTMLVALGISFGAEPILFAHVLGIACFAATLGVLWNTSRAGASRDGVIPVAVLGYALHVHATEFATSGLETALFTLLGTLALVRLVAARATRDYVLVGVLLVLASMTRPDGAVFYAAATLVTAAVARSGRSWRPLVALLAPVAVLYLPYFAWKWLYYGYPFPNTFYVRSAADPYPGAGLHYVLLYFQHYWILIPALLLAPAMLAWPGRSGAGDDAPVTDGALAPGWQGRRAALAITANVFLFLGYVVWVGGDFMFGRFLVPITPALYLAWQQFLRRLDGAMALVLCGIVVAATFASSYYRSDSAQQDARHRVTEERGVYPKWRIDLYRDIGEGLHRYLVGDSGRDVTVAIHGSQAMLAWFGRFPTVIERNGLTDEHIAHRRVTRGNFVGHEKVLPLDDPYLLRERHVHLSFGLLFPDRLPQDRIGDLRGIRFRIESDVEVDPRWLQELQLERKPDWWWGTILVYDRKVMDPLRGNPGVRFTPFDEHLDRYIAGLGGKDRSEVAEDYAAFREFYFDHNQDPERQRAFERFLGGR